MGRQVHEPDQLRHLHDHGGEHRYIDRDRNQDYYERTIRREFVSLPWPLGQKKATVNEKGPSEMRTYNRGRTASPPPQPGRAGCASAGRPARQAMHACGSGRARRSLPPPHVRVGRPRAGREPFNPKRGGHQYQRPDAGRTARASSTAARRRCLARWPLWWRWRSRGRSLGRRTWSAWGWGPARWTVGVGYSGRSG